MRIGNGRMGWDLEALPIVHYPERLPFWHAGPPKDEDEEKERVRIFVETHGLPEWAKDWISYDFGEINWHTDDYNYGTEPSHLVKDKDGNVIAEHTFRCPSMRVTSLRDDSDRWGDEEWYAQMEEKIGKDFSKDLFGIIFRTVETSWLFSICSANAKEVAEVFKAFFPEGEETDDMDFKEMLLRAKYREVARWLEKTSEFECYYHLSL